MAWILKWLFLSAVADIVFYFISPLWYVFGGAAFIVATALVSVFYVRREVLAVKSDIHKIAKTLGIPNGIA